MKMLRLPVDSPHPIGLVILSRLCRLSDAVLCRYRSKIASSVLQLSNQLLDILSMTHITRIPSHILMLVRANPGDQSLSYAERGGKRKKKEKKRKSSHQFETRASNDKTLARWPTAALPAVRRRGKCCPQSSLLIALLF